MSKNIKKIKINQLIHLFAFSSLCLVPMTLLSCSKKEQAKYEISFRTQTQFNLGNEEIEVNQVDANWIKNRIVENKNQIFKILNEPNNFKWEEKLKISNIITNNIKGEISFTCELLSSNSNDQNISSNLVFSGFKMNSNNVLPELDSQGGEFNSLQISSYLNSIKLLDLKPTNLLSNLNNQDLTQKIQTFKGYENIQIQIEEGSNEEEGKLNLLMFGEYNKIQVFKHITILGFYNFKSNFIVSNLSINQDNYFNNKQPILEAPNLLINEDLNIKKSLIKDCNFYFDNQAIEWSNIETRYKIEDLSIKKIQNNLRFNFVLKTQFKSFNNNQWTLNKDQVTLYQKFNNLLEISLPTLYDLMFFMIDMFTLKDEIVNYYPSFFKGLFNYSYQEKVDYTTLVHFINYESIIQKYESTYFPNTKLYPRIDIEDINSLEANDFQQSLSFRIYLINDDEPQDHRVSKIFSSHSLKNIQEFLDSKQNEPNIIQIKDNSSFSTTIKRIYNHQITQIFNESKAQTIDLPKTEIQNYLLNNWTNIFIQNNHSEQQTKKINSNLIFSIFGYSLYNYNFGHWQGKTNKQATIFDVDTGNFTIEGNTYLSFNINNIYLDFKDFSIQLIMNNNYNVATIEITTPMILTISQKEIIHSTKIVLPLTRSNIN